MRIILDTNVLIDGASDGLSVAAKFIQAAIEGECTALLTPAIEREYRRKVRELVTDEEYVQIIEDFLAAAEQVHPAHVDVQIDDIEDRKFLQAAVGGNADMVITSDRHLLAIGELDQIRMLKPLEAWAVFEEETESSSEWQSWASGLGIGR